MGELCTAFSLNRNCLDLDAFIIPKLYNTLSQCLIVMIGPILDLISLQLLAAAHHNFDQISVIA